MAAKILKNLLEKCKDFLLEKLPTEYVEEELPPFVMLEDELFEDLFHETDFGDK